MQLRDILLLLIFVGLLPLGLFLMKRLDHFLDDEHASVKKPEEVSERPKCVSLSDHSSDEEILKTIHAFRSEHAHFSVVISEEEKDKNAS